LNAPIGLTEWLGVPCRCGPIALQLARRCAGVALWLPECISGLAHGLDDGLMTEGVNSAGYAIRLHCGRVQRIAFSAALLKCDDVRLD